jgi:hypothetical protein
MFANLRVRDMIAAAHTRNLGIHPGPKMMRLEFRDGITRHILRYHTVSMGFPCRLVVAIITQHLGWKILNSQFLDPFPDMLALRVLGDSAAKP